MTRSRVAYSLAIEGVFSAPLTAARAGSNSEEATARGEEGPKSVEKCMHPCPVTAQADEVHYASPLKHDRVCSGVTSEDTRHGVRIGQGTVAEGPRGTVTPSPGPKVGYHSGAHLNQSPSQLVAITRSGRNLHAVEPGPQDPLFMRVFEHSSQVVVIGSKSGLNPRKALIYNC